VVIQRIPDLTVGASAAETGCEGGDLLR